MDNFETMLDKRQEEGDSNKFEVARKVEQKKNKDITFITTTRLMVDTLKTMFPDTIAGDQSNLGEHYFKNNENIFQNDYLQTL